MCDMLARQMIHEEAWPLISPSRTEELSARFKETPRDSNPGHIFSDAAPVLDNLLRFHDVKSWISDFQTSWNILVYCVNGHLGIVWMYFGWYILLGFIKVLLKHVKHLNNIKCSSDPTLPAYTWLLTYVPEWSNHEYRCLCRQDPFRKPWNLITWITWSWPGATYGHILLAVWT